MQLAQINLAEAIIAPLFDARLADLSSYAVSTADKRAMILRQSWDSVTLAGDSGAFTLTWSGTYRFRGYDALRLFINFPSHLRLSGTATIDGQHFTLFTDVPGESLPFEPTSPPLVTEAELHELTHLALHFIGEPDRTVTLSLYWIGLVALAREPELDQQRPQYSPDWPGLLNPRGMAEIVEPLWGSAQVMADIRTRAGTAHFAPLMRGLRRCAEEYQSYAPEPDIRDYIPCDEHMFRYVRVRDRGRPRWEHPQRVQVLALAGYLDNQPAWSRLAARMVLAITHTPYWFEGPQGHCPGSDWHHVCFMESHVMGALCTALPFLGDWLTPTARALVLDRIEDAWALVNASCEEPGYRWFMNQGIVGNSLRLLGAALLAYAGRGDRYTEAVEQSYRDHTTIINNYLADDGHCSEGGYYTYSFFSSVPMWLAYSVFTGQPLSAVVPDRFLRSTAYLEAATSSLYPDGAMLPLGPGGVGKPWSVLLLAVLRHAGGWQGGNEWLRRHLARDAEVSADEALALLVLAPDLLPPTPPPGLLQGCPESGLAAFHFPATRRGKFVVQAERPASGHHHHDRGGIVLEDLGEALLPDLGSRHYADLRCAHMHRADWHNLAHPLDLPMRLTSYPAAGITVPAARIERMAVTDTGCDMAMNLTPIYEAHVTQGRREGTLRLHATGGSLVLLDHWAFDEPHPVELLFNAYAPWTLERDGVAGTRIGALALRVAVWEAHGAVLTGSVLDDRIDANAAQVWTLRWLTPACQAVSLQSEVTWELIP